ncbi:unnamed protein product, partial [Mesorhabditis belari]|uniref:C-type lectin domain-containing protein n=1 Tax=Mesorhabditis belari TaxID=2138241 RepID=A0AAF3EB18_9BILA
MRYLVLLSFFISYSNADFTCPQGTTQLGSEHRCVYIHPTAEYYNWGARKCRDFGGYLAKMTNYFETSLIFALAGQSLDVSPYIGAQKMANGTWRFADGTPLNYSNWAPGEPNASDDNVICAILDIQSTKWKAVDCGAPRPFICTIEGDKAMTKQSTSNFNNGAASNLRCDYSYTWIGYIGDGQLNHGSWSDGTVVDYVAPYGSRSDEVPWKMINTNCYANYVQWSSTALTGVSARYICKQPSTMRARREAAEKL